MLNCSECELYAYNKYETHGSRVRDIYISIVNKNPDHIILFSLDSFKTTIIHSFLCTEQHFKKMRGAYLSVEGTHLLSIVEAEEVLLKQCSYHIAYCTGVLENKISYHLPAYKKTYKENVFNLGEKYSSPQKIINTLDASRRVLSKMEDAQISAHDSIDVWDDFFIGYYENIKRLQNIVIEMREFFSENEDKRVKKYTLYAAVVSCIIAAAFGCVNLYSSLDEAPSTDQTLPSPKKSAQD